ncbi:MAG: CDP-diacylglycerol--serine O-phosphatidyltransferase [Gammaproteobacteria bacterium]|nr:CDP-diacylglycerol--serine O-phosphatidyltransferase [Gammaproteobacteria bacterium]
MSETMETEQQQTKRRKGIYLLPNLITTAGLFGGFYGIVAAMNGRFEHAAIAIFIAMILDGLDGRVARLTNTQTAFGAEFDSLADMVSFGVAPALIMYTWSLSSMTELGWQWGKVGWMVVFIYTAGAALRLARFNTQVGIADKRYFMGLPSPAAAACVVGFVWVCVDQDYAGKDMIIPAAVITLLAGLLMVSNFLFSSFKEVDFKHKVPFTVLLVAVLVLMFASFDPPKVLFAGFVFYMLSGPLLSVARKFKSPKKTKPAKATQENK